MPKKKTIQDLTQKDILEDLDYYLTQTQMRCPPFVDEMFNIIRQYTKELEGRILEIEERIEELESEDSEDCYCETHRIMVEDRD